MMKNNRISILPSEKEVHSKKLLLLQQNINTKIKEKGSRIRFQELFLYLLSLSILYFLLSLNGESMMSRNG